MRIIAAYLLSVLGGNDAPDASAVKKILDSVGATADDAELTKLIGELSGKDINEVIAAGNAKLATVPTGGSGGGAAPATGGAAAAGGAAPAAAKKEEEKPKEKSEESEADMGFSLFD